MVNVFGEKQWVEAYWTFNDKGLRDALLFDGYDVQKANNDRRWMVKMTEDEFVNYRESYKNGNWNANSSGSADNSSSNKSSTVSCKQERD